MKNSIITFFSILLFSVGSYAADSIKIISVSPDQSQELKVGSEVKITYEVEYTLESSEMGEIALEVQGASNNEILANEFYIATKGKHTETLEATITIPDTRLINVITYVLPKGLSSTDVVESRMYKVVK